MGARPASEQPLSRGRVAEWPVTDPILQAGTVSRQRDGSLAPSRRGRTQVIARPCRRIGQAPAVLTGPGQRLSASPPPRRYAPPLLDKEGSCYGMRTTTLPSCALVST